MDTKLKTSYYDEPVPPLYQEVMSEVDGKFSDVAFRWSFKHVPHLLLEHNEMVYSLCYFKRYTNWRLFYPYQGQQNKSDFNTWQEAVDFILG